MLPDRNAIKAALLSLLRREGGVAPDVAYERLAERFSLSSSDRSELTTDGEEKWKKDVRWARLDLVKEGLVQPVESAGRGQWLLVEDTESLAPVICNTSEEMDKALSSLKPPRTPPPGQIRPKRSAGSADRFERDAQVVKYVLAEAGGFCECCGKQAPFKDQRGNPYLEVHHVRWLADGGSDTTSNSVAVCPNCHRALHSAANRCDLRDSLYREIGRLVRE